MDRMSLRKIVIVMISILLIAIIVKFAIPVYKIMSPYVWRVFLPFIIAIIISYVLYPILQTLTHRLNMHQTSAIVIIFISFFSLLSLLIYKGLPIFIHELQELNEQLPQLIRMYDGFRYSIYYSTSFLPDAAHEQIHSLIVKLELTLQAYLERILNQLVHLVDDFIRLLIVPVLVFYLLKDFEHIRDYVKRFIPKSRTPLLEQLLIAVHEAFSTYIRGQTILSSFIFSITFLLFYFIDLKYAFVLSLFMGVMNVIPYFGPIIGTVPAAIVALASSERLLVYVIVIAIIVQIIESALLSPYIMGKTAKLHPIAIVFILLVSSELGGVIAMIIAIPLVMVVRAVVLNIMAQKQQCIDI